jgi:lipoate-protein ligase A
VVCEGIIRGLKSLGVSADFQSVNDVVVSGRKISGNAQTRHLGIMLQHGTILVDADLEKMFRLLKVSDKKIRDKMITSAEKRVTTLKNELGDRLSLDDVAKALTRGFQEALKITLKKGELSSSEIIHAETLKKEKYANPEWTKRR